MTYKLNNMVNHQKLFWLSGLLFFCIGFTVHAATLSFVDHGNVTKTIAVDELAHLSELKSLTVNNPTDSTNKSYMGVQLISLMDVVFTSKWQSNDAIKFTATDGYQVIIPISVVVKHNAMIAIGENGKIGFSQLVRSNTERIDPGPFFLVWENIIDVAARKESWLSWPWQLSRIELTSFKREYPNSTPPATSSKAVKRGFLAFRQHCIKCHTLNGDGGDIGPELNYPVSVTEYWQAKWLSQFIANPQSVRANSKMIPFYRDVENREAQISDILKYLQMMARHKYKAH